MKIIGITWQDTATYSGWRTDVDELAITEIYTVGFLVYEDKQCVKLAATISAGGQPADVTVIPKRSITKRTILKI